MHHIIYYQKRKKLRTLGLSSEIFQHKEIRSVGNGVVYILLFSSQSSGYVSEGLKTNESEFLCAQMQNSACGLNSFNPSDGPKPSEVSAARIRFFFFKCFTQCFTYLIFYTEFLNMLLISLHVRYFTYILSECISKYTTESVFFSCLFLQRQ